MKQKFAQAVRILTTPPVFSALMCTLLYVLVPGSFASLGHYLLAIVCLSLLPVLAYGALALMMSAVTRKSGASIAVTLLLMFGSEIVMTLISAYTAYAGGAIPGIKFLFFANTSLGNYLPSAAGGMMRRAMLWCAKWAEFLMKLPIA